MNGPAQRETSAAATGGGRYGGREALLVEAALPPCFASFTTIDGSYGQLACPCPLADKPAAAPVKPIQRRA